MKPPFPYYGGKQMLADRVISLLPEHRHYVEPYGGSFAFLLAKPRTAFETVNDLDGDLVNFWRVLRERSDELEVACRLTPHARLEHATALDSVDHPVDELERARRTWVLLTQGQSGGTARRTGWRYFANPAGSTFSMPQYLEAYCNRFGPAVARLHGVSLECRPAVEIVERYGRHPEVLLLVDPPYVRSTRKGVGYRHEMTDADHRELAAALHAARCAVVLCGYPSDLYDLDLYAEWNRLAMDAGTGNGGEWRDRTEVLWSNRPLGTQRDLFADMDGAA